MMIDSFDSNQIVDTNEYELNDPNLLFLILSNSKCSFTFDTPLVPSHFPAAIDIINLLQTN